LLDIGCGWKAELLRAAEPYIASGVGIDFKAPDLQDPKLQTISVTLDSTLPFDDDCFDVVTLMAVLEHLQNPDAILREARRVLKKGKGILLGTVPSKWGKPVLEFLAYTAGIVNPDEILDHKQYFDKASLTAILREAGFNDIRHKYFQLGMNNFWIARA
jgi:ubiquinone/menaquinone biosynthesis C-methylase UbiE